MTVRQIKNIFHGQTLVTIFLFTLYFQANGQTNTTNEKAAKLSKKNVTYLWFGRACPTFIDTKTIYGFKIKCVGCVVTPRIKRHNARTEKKINEVYWENWFEQNKGHFPQ